MRRSHAALVFIPFLRGRLKMPHDRHEAAFKPFSQKVTCAIWRTQPRITPYSLWGTEPTDIQKLAEIEAYWRRYNMLEMG